MYLTGIAVAIVHQVWMALFMYSWLILVRDSTRDMSIYFGIFLSTLFAWNVYGACPITELQDALFSGREGEVGAFISMWWPQVLSFVGMCALVALSLRRITAEVRTWTLASVEAFFDCNGALFVSGLIWINVIVLMFKFSLWHTLASMVVTVAAFTVWCWCIVQARKRAPCTF